MPEGKILRGHDEDRDVIKLVGHVRHTMSRALDAVVEGLFSSGRAAAAVFDLSEAVNLDSTVLGLMAKAARKAREAGAPRPVIMSPRRDVELVLASMGFNEVFDVRPEQAYPAAELYEVPTAQTAGTDSAAVVLDAHRALSELSDRNRAVFEKVVAMMEKDIGRKTPGTGI